MAGQDKRIAELNQLQDTLTKRLQAVEKRIKEMEDTAQKRKAMTAQGLKAPLLNKSEKERRVERIDKAAWELEDAIYDKKIKKSDDNEKRKYPGDGGIGDLTRARGHHVELLEADKRYTAAMVCLVILTFIEVPPWCHEKARDIDMWKFVAGDVWCQLPSPKHALDSNPNLSGIWYLPPGISFLVEIVIEFFVIDKFWREYTLDRDHFGKMGDECKLMTRLNSLGMLFAIGSIIDTALFMFVRMPLRFTFICRTGLIFLLPGVQKTFFKIFDKGVMFEFGSVAIFMVGTICFFAWVAVALFGTANAEEDPTFKPSYKEDGKPVYASEGFESFTEAVNTMFVGGVTGEFIDCYLPSFVSYRASGLLWMIYLCLTQVLFKNLVMDTLITAYLNGKEKDDAENLKCQVKGMQETYRLLSDDGEEINKEDFLAFIGVLGKSPRWKRIPEEAAARIFDNFQTESESGRIDKEVFSDLCCIIQHNIWLTPRSSSFVLDKSAGPNTAIVKPSMQYLYDSVWETEVEDEEQSFPPATQNSKFDNFMTKVLLLNLVMVVVESVYDLMEWTEPLILDYIDLVFSFLYLGEVLMKLAVKSWAEYWSSGANQFDFFTTWLLLATSVLPLVTGGGGAAPVKPGGPTARPGAGPVLKAPKSPLSKYANILRLLRLIRILKQLKDYENVQFMMVTISRIMSEAGDVLALMGTFFYFFSNLAVNLFGGLLYEGNEALEETEYAEKHWYVLNFNDMFMAFMTWFVQILCEYVPNYTVALNATGTAAGLWYGPFSGLVVFFFYITTAAIMYELLLAFTVEVFMVVKEEMYADSDSESEDEEEGGSGEEGEKKEEEKKKEEKKEEESDSEEEWKAEQFLGKVKERLIEQRKDLYPEKLTIEMEVQEEINEKYEKLLEKNGFEKSEDPEAGSDANICKASWVYENGIYSQPGDLDKLGDTLVAAREEHLKVLQATSTFYKAICGVVILTLWEVPAWCHEAKGVDLGHFTWASGTEWCQAESGEADLNLSGIWYLPPGYAFVVEIILEMFIVRKFILEYQFEKKFFTADNQFSYMNNIIVGSICAFGSLLDTGIFTVFKYPLRATFVFRTGLLCLLPGVQRLSERIFTRKMLGQFVSVAVFFVGTIFFYAWIAVTVYKHADSPAYVDAEGKVVHENRGFESLRASVYTMFLAGMTEGFSDIFIPTVTSYRLAGVLWLSFLLLCQVLFLNLVIDAFVAAYLENSEKHLSVTAGRQAGTIFKAAQLLFKEEKLDMETFKKFVAELSKSPRMSSWEPDVAEAVYVQFEEEEGITAECFVDACTLVNFKIFTVPADSCLASKPMWNSPWFVSVRDYTKQVEEAPQYVWTEKGVETIKEVCEFDAEKNAIVNIDDVSSAVAKVYDELEPDNKEKADLINTMCEDPKEHVAGEAKECLIKKDDETEKTSRFDVLMDNVLLGNLLYMVVQQMWMEASKEWCCGWTAWGLEIFFTFVYVFEVGVKLAVRSFSSYWATGANKFDFFTTWLLFGTWILKYIPIAELQTDLVKYANIIRLFRLLRVAKKLNKNKQARFMVNTIIRMVGAAGDILALLGVVLFFFTTFSVNFFGGLLYEGNEKLEGSDFEEKHWFVFNFNDVIMAFGTWFTQLLCEYAPEWADALYRVSRFGEIAWYIYPVFYLLGVAVVFEILKAFTIEAFLAIKEEEDAEEGESEGEESSDSEDEGPTLQDKIMRKTSAQLKEKNLSLHIKKSPMLTKGFQKELMSAYEEALEDEKKRAEE